MKTDNSIGLRPGSEATVQIFVPTTDLHLALRDCDGVLEQEGYRRLELVKQVPFEPGEHYQDAPKFVLDDVTEARSKGKPVVGTFFISRQLARFQNQSNNAELDAEQDPVVYRVYVVKQGLLARLFQRLIRIGRGGGI